MKISTTLLFLFTFSLTLTAQESYKGKSEAFSQIKQLRNGSLIVLLNLKSDKAEQYRSIGKDKLAIKIEKRLKEQNQLLIQLFEDENFHFCPVFFTEKENYGKVYNGVQTGVFLNDKLEIDSTKKMETSNFYFLDFGNVYEKDPETNLEMSSPLIQEALIFKNKKLKALERPFPYYIDLDGAINPIVNFESYTALWKNNSNAVKNILTYQYYLESKFNLTEKESFMAEKIFLLNVKLFNFLDKAMKNN